ncbi:MAG TPA: hypothetical protein VJH23_00870 [archaeon]|nr:hypothetical protein [archaeon]
MKEYTLQLSGMTCGSCEHLIEKVVARNGASVNAIDATLGFVRLTCDESQIGTIRAQLAEKGFAETDEISAQRGNLANVWNYARSIISAKPEVEVEAKLLNYAMGSAIVLALLSAAAYLFALNGIPNKEAYLPLIALSVVTAISTAYPYYHAKCYTKRMSCSNGMMSGMIMGMMPGFMVGALLGATNGMFIGSTLGLIAGIFMGVKIGKCCGVMGALEGVMAGLMAGIMGAMTSVMMLNDNLIAFLYIMFAVCVFVLAGMSYMMHREAGHTPKQEFRTNFTGFLAASTIIWGLLMAFMAFGPKGPLTFI